MKARRLTLYMLHSQIENDEVIERYVRNQLASEERQEFEEHFFACEECFEKLQSAERLVAGVRDAAERRLLTEPQAPLAIQSRWLVWAFAVSSCAAVAFVALTSWLSLSQIPKLRAEVEQASAQLRVQQQLLAQLEGQINSADLPEANPPLVILQASRAQETANTVIPSSAKRLVVWIEVGPTRYRTFRMELSQQGHTLVSINDLRRSPYGPLAAGIPTNALPSGNFSIKLTGQDPPPASLVGEYQLEVRKP